MAGVSLLEELTRRGLVEQTTHEDALQDALENQSVSVYCGVDPTADSIHVGHLLPFLTLARMQERGHKPVILVGGATGMIGDPSGRDSERTLLSDEDVAENVRKIRAQLEQFVSFEGENAAVMVNNHDWIGQMSYIEWLRDVGKYFTVNYMVAKESVRRRLEDRDQGISYTEFSYMLLQAYDYYHLNKTLGCKLQIGGNDQWGNITAGIELIRKRGGGEAFGMTLPLLTTAAGEKFGKSAGNAVWLDADKTSPYELYQFFLRTEDADIQRLLLCFSQQKIDAIEELMRAHQEAPHKRAAQRALAEEMTARIHGDAGLERAQRASDVLFGSEISGFDDKELSEIFADVPSAELERARLEEGYPVVEVLADSGLYKSRGEARRALKAGGAYINNRRAEGQEQVLTLEDLASETVMVLRKGKRNYMLARFN